MIRALTILTVLTAIAVGASIIVDHLGGFSITITCAKVNK